MPQLAVVAHFFGAMYIHHPSLLYFHDMMTITYNKLEHTFVCCQNSTKVCPCVADQKHYLQHSWPLSRSLKLVLISFGIVLVLSTPACRCHNKAILLWTIMMELISLSTYVLKVPTRLYYNLCLWCCKACSFPLVESRRQALDRILHWCQFHNFSVNYSKLVHRVLSRIIWEVVKL